MIVQPYEDSLPSVTGPSKASSRPAEPVKARNHSMRRADALQPKPEAPRHVPMPRRGKRSGDGNQHAVPTDPQLTPRTTAQLLVPRQLLFEDVGLKTWPQLDSASALTASGARSRVRSGAVRAMIGEPSDLPPPAKSRAQEKAPRSDPVSTHPADGVTTFTDSTTTKPSDTTSTISTRMRTDFLPRRKRPRPNRTRRTFRTRH